MLLTILFIGNNNIKLANLSSLDDKKICIIFSRTLELKKALNNLKNCLRKMKLSFLNYPEISKNNLPDYVLFLIKRIEERGFISFLVGGCVRDLIYQKQSKDWDIVTDARIEEIQDIFKNYKTLLIGRRYNTITIIIDSKVCHISTIRIGEKQQFKMRQSIKNYLLIKDLLCRDFTINSLAWHPDKGILDPSGGLGDLGKRVIRSLEPDIRFQADPLRMLRAIRIACELDFKVEKKTKNSIIKQAFLIQHTSPERIRDELCSIFRSLNVQKGIIMIRQYGLEHHILSLDKIKRELLISKDIKPIFLSGFNIYREDLPTQLALWGRLVFNSCQKAQLFYLPLIVYLKFSRRIINKLKILLSIEWTTIDFSSREKIRFLMSDLGREYVKIIFNLKKMLLLSEQNTEKINKLLNQEEIMLQEEIQKNSPTSLKELAICGEDLIKMGISPGEKIGEILHLMLQKVLICPESNQKSILLNMVKELKKEMDDCGN